MLKAINLCHKHSMAMNNNLLRATLMSRLSSAGLGIITNKPEHTSWMHHLNCSLDRNFENRDKWNIFSLRRYFRISSDWKLCITVPQNRCYGWNGLSQNMNAILDACTLRFSILNGPTSRVRYCISSNHLSILFEFIWKFMISAIFDFPISFRIV